MVLDVVYNHIGPEGSVLREFGPYFTDRYRTPWGPAFNFDGRGSDAVREFCIENARFWVRDAHVDGFRLDAVHAIADNSAYPFVEEFTDELHALGRALGREVVVIAESADNNSLLTAPTGNGGRGFDAQWSEDFHHALHVALTGEQHGYYRDYTGGAELADAFEHGFVYRGRYSQFRGHQYGRAQPPVALGRLVVFGQNHDQVGNRPRGDRLIALAGFEAAKTALACTLLAPSIPLLFMGEEQAARTPFPYFVRHSDPDLVEAVRRGRAAEFADLPGESPDPQAESTFLSAVLTYEDTPEADAMRALCRDLIALRRSPPALRVPVSVAPRATWDEASRLLTVALGTGAEEVLLVVQFVAGSGHPSSSDVLPDGPWRVVCDSAAAEYLGPTSLGNASDPQPAPSAQLLVKTSS